MKTLIISFVLIVIVQLTVPLKIIHDKQSPLIYGQEFTFKTEPIDPYDPFRGKYVTLSFSDNYLEMDEYKKWKYGETVYVQFFEGEDGFAKIKSISKEIPENSDYYLKSKVRTESFRRGSKEKYRVYIDYPFRRYYMEESKAKRAEILARNSARDETYDVSVVVHLYKGRGSIKKLQVNDTPMEEAVHHNDYGHH